MKKAICIVFLFITSLTVFASFSVGVGPVLNRYNGTGDIRAAGEEKDFTTYGYGADARGVFGLFNNFSIYADLNIVFPQKYNIGSTEYTKDILREELGNASDKTVGMIMLDAGTGVIFTLFPNQNVSLSVGGGVFFNTFRVRKTGTVSNKTTGMKFYSNTIGLSVYANIDCKITDEMSFGITALPHFGLYNITKINQYDSSAPEPEAFSGFRNSFSIPVVLSFSYYLI